MMGAPYGAQKAEEAAELQVAGGAAAGPDGEEIRGLKMKALPLV